MKYLDIILPAALGLWLATCGLVGAFQEGDATKAMLVFWWLLSTWQYLTWKKRALQATQLLQKVVEGEISGLFVKDEDEEVMEDT